MGSEMSKGGHDRQGAQAHGWSVAWFCSQGQLGTLKGNMLNTAEGAFSPSVYLTCGTHCLKTSLKLRG